MSLPSDCTGNATETDSADASRISDSARRNEAQHNPWQEYANKSLLGYLTISTLPAQVKIFSSSFVFALLSREINPRNNLDFRFGIPNNFR